MNQIMIRASFLEEQNEKLQREIEQVAIMNRQLAARLPEGFWSFA